MTDRITEAALTVAAGGLLFALIESLLPRSGTRAAAKAAIGVLFLTLVALKIAGIFR